MFLKFSSIMGFFSLGLKKFISSKFLIQRLDISSISFLDADLIFFDFMNLEFFFFKILLKEKVRIKIVKFDKSWFEFDSKTDLKAYEKL